MSTAIISAGLFQMSGQFIPQLVKQFETARSLKL